MHHLDQLKQIRSDAVARMRASDDYKLASRLGALIVELGGSVDDPLNLSKPGLGSSPAASTVSTLRSFDKPVLPATQKPDQAETANMVAELAATMGEVVEAEDKKPAFELPKLGEKRA
ncbi:MAG: hypothetical protein AAF903_03990 [Pseudomonadota bacterium]